MRRINNRVRQRRRAVQLHLPAHGLTVIEDGKGSIGDSKSPPLDDGGEEALQHTQRRTVHR